MRMRKPLARVGSSPMQVRLPAEAEVRHYRSRCHQCQPAYGIQVARDGGKRVVVIMFEPFARCVCCDTTPIGGLQGRTCGR